MIEDNADVKGALTDIDALLAITDGTNVSWTAPRWIAPGDLMFFYHTAKGAANAARLHRSRHGHQSKNLRAALARAADQGRSFGRTVFACARVRARATYEADDEGRQHFRSRVFAPLAEVHKLAVPLPLSTLGRLVPLSTGGTLTPVLGRSFQGLRDALARDNVLPPWVAEVSPCEVGLRDVSSDNWRRALQREGPLFINEAQVREYFADHLLRELKDPRTRVHKECVAYRRGQQTGRVDYVVRIHGHWVPVEAKLSVLAERDLSTQVHKYVDVDEFVPTLGLPSGRLLATPGFKIALVVDANGIYWWECGRLVGCSAEAPRWPRRHLGDVAVGEMRAAVMAAHHQRTA